MDSNWKFSRSKSSREDYTTEPRSMNDLRSYSTSDYNLKKSRISAANSSSSKSWSFNVDPELQRKKRIAGYKAYGVEGKMKTSFTKSFRWIKHACNNLVNGFR
ncbi:DUF3511 domain protein [Perilla frutescens var. frutescens]|nr:DUF3511 domain protein [Perilla frutescens var. frutescens]